MRELRLLGVAVALALALTGCVSIPHTGTASQGISLAGPGSDPSIEYSPTGPEKGASQQKILEGFVSAFSSPAGGYQVAKLFLTDELAAKWDPRASVLVRKGPPVYSQIDSATLGYSFDSVASIDPSGAYTQQPDSFDLRFSFVKHDGQWRISAAPDGVVVSQQIFRTIFSQQTLYFLDGGRQNLVPDVRWFPSGTAPTRIVLALLAGPPPWLKGAAFAAFPDGTQLSASSGVVTVNAGVADVDLSTEAKTASATEQQLMLVQLRESLQSVTSISSVTISVNGAPLQISDPGQAGPQATPAVISDPLVLRKNQFGQLGPDGRIAALSGISSKVESLDPVAVSAAPSQELAAVLSGDRSVYLVHKNAVTKVDSRGGLIAPALDPDGYVWTVPASNPQAIEATDESGAAHQVAAGILPADGRIVSLEVSRDGARIVIMLSTSAGPRLMVAGIARDQTQKLVPTNLTSATLDTTLDDGAAIGATWVDQLSVATLVNSSGTSSVRVYALGADEQSLGDLGSVTGAQIVGGNGQPGLRVRGLDTGIYLYRGSTWQSAKQKADLIATQR